MNHRLLQGAFLLTTQKDDNFPVTLFTLLASIYNSLSLNLEI